VEWDLTWGVNDNNTLTFGGSYNNAKLQTDFWRKKEFEEAGEPPNAPAWPDSRAWCAFTRHVKCPAD